jgi:hypothetical protein
MPDYFTHFTDAGELVRIAFPQELPLEERAAYMAAPPADAETLPVSGYAPPLDVPKPAPTLKASRKAANPTAASTAGPDA